MPRPASFKHQRELDAFVRYCVLRIEKELGYRERWIVELEVSTALYACRVISVHLGLELEATGHGPDSELATWDAMCRMEQLLRERRGSVVRSSAYRLRASREGG